MPKCDFRYSKSHLMPPKTFLECTGSVVGWYGLLAPEIMEVLEASPWNPSASSLFLMISLYAPTRTGTFSTVAQWIPHRLALKTKKNTLCNTRKGKNKNSLLMRRSHKLLCCGEHFFLPGNNAYSANIPRWSNAASIKNVIQIALQLRTSVRDDSGLFCTHRKHLFMELEKQASYIPLLCDTFM